MLRFVWVFPLLGAVLGTLILAGGFYAANTRGFYDPQAAPTDLAAAAVALAVAVIPFVIARAITEIAARRSAGAEGAQTRDSRRASA